MSPPPDMTNRKFCPARASFYIAALGTCGAAGGFASFAASAIAASAAWPYGWMRPADMISFAASSAEIGSSMTWSAGM